MEKNEYLETLLSLCNLPYVIWIQASKKTENDQNVPFQIYNKMFDFYQTLDFDDILEHNCVYQVETALGINNLLIPGNGQIYVIGPYLKEKISTAEFFLYLINNNLPISHELNVFYHSLPVFEQARLNVIYQFLNYELDIAGFCEIKQETSIPTQNHLHSQIYQWNHAERAFSTLISAEADLYTAFLSANRLVMHETEERYLQTIKGIEYNFELDFIKKHLQTTNCFYQRLSHIKLNQLNRIDSLYYQFCIEIQQLESLAEAYQLQKIMYEAYCDTAASFSYHNYPEMIQQALHYINQNWKHKITLTELSKALSVNKSHLSTMFNKTMNMSLSDYINVLRIDWAEFFLKSTSLSATDISVFCGYDDASYFGKVYKKIKGETPLQTRRKNRERG